MGIAESRRVQLAAILEDLHRPDSLIDNPRIERALIALIETMSEPGAVGAEAPSPGHLTRLHGA